MVEITELEQGDKVTVELSYGSENYVVELYGDPQEEWEEHGMIGGKVRQSGRAPECPNVGMDATIRDLSMISNVDKANSGRRW